VKQKESFTFPTVSLPKLSEDEVLRYRQKAEECRARAMSCGEPSMVAGWLDLAASWNDLTERADRRRASATK
jgi:hypothetical protein